MRRLRLRRTWRGGRAVEGGWYLMGPSFQEEDVLASLVPNQVDAQRN